MIRLLSIELNNFKNVAHGKASLSSWREGAGRVGSDVVGVYGQNGSGKTSIVNALGILKACFLGQPLPSYARDCIEVGSYCFKVGVEGLVCDSAAKPLALFSYELEAGLCEENPSVLSEKLAYKPLSSRKTKMRTVFDSSGDAESCGFELKPKLAWEAMASSSMDFYTSAIVSWKLAREKGSSFLFSDSFEKAIERFRNDFGQKRERGEKVSKEALKAYDELLPFFALAQSGLKLFALRDFVVMPPSRQAEPMMNLLRMSTHEGDLGKFADASFNIDLRKPSLVSEGDIPVLESTVDTVSLVLGALVPGLELGVVRLGEALMDDGTPGVRLEIIATRGGVSVPLRCESEGIKKLAAILVLLIDVYSSSAACVVIDELDSGVFEFLLGEILQVLQDHGKGQLIFTAHNLRPLETMEKGSLVFTTTNPQRRYIPFAGLKPTNNMRRQYLKAINLGGQAEMVYEPTSRYEIDAAFYDASHPDLGEE